MSARLRCVTITGADDSVAPAELVALSRQYPFVEWGILQSPKRSGTPRYPSRDWCLAFGEVYRDVAFAVHMCGQYAREVYAGDDTSLLGLPAHARVQVNGLLETPSAWTREERSPLEQLGRRHPGREIILQVGGPQTLGTAEIMAQHGSPNFSALRDASGGRGLAEAWPPPKWTEEQSRGIRLGFAGGIGPDNVVSVLESIFATHPREFWIDMESGVRTNDVFDLAKVRRALWLAAPFIAHQEQEAESA